MVRGSNHDHINLTQDQIDNADLYEKLIEEYVSDNSHRIVSPELKKGDVIFWNSKTVHGSFKTVNSAYSRKSFTCHFIPKELELVRNVYYPLVRSCEGLDLGDVNFRFTSNVNKDEIIKSNPQKPRNLSSFKNFD